MVNARNEDRFAKLFEEAKGGGISKDEFVKEILRAEYEGIKCMHDLLPLLKLGRREMSESRAYKRFVGCPSKFEDFPNSVNLNLMKEYGARYDWLRSNSGS